MVEVKDPALKEAAVVVVVADAEDTAEALSVVRVMILVGRTAAVPPVTTRVRLEPILVGATPTAVVEAAEVAAATAVAGKCQGRVN